MADATRPPSVPPAEPSLESAGLCKDPWSPRPDEKLRFLFFEGLLEMTVGVRADVEAALDKVEQAELGEARLDIDGRRARL
ncbi:MAG TPA: hypothetical protein VM509_00015, partial [Planctomycetota bacterium]|nr:hypothetical protein [Planctomycetota bacterium]